MTVCQQAFAPKFCSATGPGLLSNALFLLEENSFRASNLESFHD